MPVRTQSKIVSLPTYPVGKPEKHPVFIAQRVYQGSDGSIYPLPFIDKVADDPIEQDYQLLSIENEYVYLELLPEIGGRIFKAQDKTNHNYDFFYRQDVIKPALVGLAGPWISGGVEFNWPQHHRPGTFLPSDWYIEEEPDGARTIWMSEHDPISHMRGLHGVRLRPGSAVIELRVRLCNRTPHAQTFLWWANAAVRVHDQYQSFFPPDVAYVADHAVRALSSFPLAKNSYYGIDYRERPEANDLRFYRNIPVPTSYMICESNYDFFGGYDHQAKSGFVHYADRHIAPGKKQWTWGNHDFGWAWDRELTDEGGPYIELMSGVYTDNQPDFSYLAPYEERSFSQYWWPFQKIGPVHNANNKVALRLELTDPETLEIGLVAAEIIQGAKLELRYGQECVLEETLSVAPGIPWIQPCHRPEENELTDYHLSVFDQNGECLLSYRPAKPETERKRALAEEPPLPSEIKQIEELYLVGEHLEQYRHPTRNPEIYYDEILQRDPDDSRANCAMGRRCIRRGQAEKAITFLQRAIQRLTAYHPNPITGEAHYLLGLAWRDLGDLNAAYDAFFKSTWNYEWQGPAYFELAAIASRQGDLKRADQHARASLESDPNLSKSAVLRMGIARRGNHFEEARLLEESVLRRDPLNHWGRFESALRNNHFDSFFERIRNDAQTVLDLAFDYERIGFLSEAIYLLQEHHRRKNPACAVPNPLGKSLSTYYLLGRLLTQTGATEAAETVMRFAAQSEAIYFFPSRTEEAELLASVVDSYPEDANAAMGLGHFLYAHSRREEAIQFWRIATDRDASLATAWRNLGIAFWNVQRDGKTALEMYQKATSLEPNDARLHFEQDQLCKLLGHSTQTRLKNCLERIDLVKQRDDFSVEVITMLNASKMESVALNLLLERPYHPWEGGEGKLLEQYKRAMLTLGQQTLAENNPEEALKTFQQILKPPHSLGETFHPNQLLADVHYWIGRAYEALNQPIEAKAAFEESISRETDFQDMAVASISTQSYYRGLSLAAIGQTARARDVFNRMLDYVATARKQTFVIDYFATSMPTVGVFENDLQAMHAQRLDEIEDLAQRGLESI